MVKAEIINSRQLVCLIILCRLFNFLTFVPRTANTYEGALSIFSIFIGFFINILCLIPAAIFLKKYPGQNIIDAAQEVSPLAGKVTAALIWLLTIFLAIETTSHFNAFMTTAIYPKASSVTFVLLLTVAAIYFVTMGIEPMGRVGVIFLAVVAISLVIISIALVPQVDFLNVRTPSFENVSIIFESLRVGLGQSIDIVLFLLLIPHVKGNIKKCYVWYLAIMMVVLEILNFFALTVLGEYGLTRAYPIYTLTAISHLSFLQRLDSFHMGIWVFIAVLRVAVYLFLAKRSLDILTNGKTKKISLWLNGLIIVAVSMIYATNLKIFTGSYKVFLSGFPSLIYLIGIPAALLVIDTVKRRKKKS